MFNTLSGLIFMFLVLIGTVAICYYIMLKLLLPKRKQTFYVFIPCNRNSQKVREYACEMRVKLNLFGDERNSKIVVLDSGMNDYERENVQSVCKESNGIYLVDKKYLKDFLDGRI